MKKIIFFFCCFWAAMTALSAQDPLMYGKYNMSVPSQFNEAVFRDAPVVFEYKRLSWFPFLNADSTDVHTSHWLLVTHVLCSNTTLKVGDTVMITVHAGNFLLKLSAESLFPLSDSMPGSEYKIEQTIVPARYKTVDAGYTPIYEKGIVFCKQNTDIYPVAYKNCPKSKSFVLFYTVLGLKSCLHDASLYGDITYWGMGDLKFKELKHFYDYTEQYKKYNRKIIPSTVPCPQETTPLIIEKVSQPKKKKGKTNILRKIGFLGKKTVDANLFLRLGNATVTGSSSRYLEFDILVHTDQTVRIGTHLLYLKFDANIFGLINNNDTTKIKITPSTVFKNKITASYTSYNEPTDSPSDTIVVSISETSTPVVFNTTDQALVHIKMKIQNCGGVSGLRFVKTTFNLPAQQYRDNTAPFGYHPYATISFTQPNFRMATPNALYLCPAAACTLSPTTVRAGVGEWVTLTPPAGTVLSANTYRVQFRDGDSNNPEEKISVSDSVQFLTNPTRVRVKVPGCARRDSTASAPIFTGNAGKGAVFITPKTSDLPIFKSSVELNVEYSIMENVYEGGKHCRFNLANLANCAKIYKNFV